LEWWKKSWFHACLGNHEQMLLSSDNPLSFLNWMFNGGEWWLQQDEITRQQFRLAIARLPLAMEIEARCGLIGVVHADVPENMSWQEFTHALESNDPSALNAALWGRARAEGQVTCGVKGIDHVICGHTIMSGKEIHRVANVWLIDSGAFLRESGGKLSLFPLSNLYTGIFASEAKNLT
jgi:serine/threonine protein phosphatase 1